MKKLLWLPLILTLTSEAKATIYDNPADRAEYAFGHSGGPCSTPACWYGNSERDLERKRDDNWNEYLRQKQEDE